MTDDVPDWMAAIKCPSCFAGPGRQNPDYTERSATGWFACEVCGVRYVSSGRQLWIPRPGCDVLFADRGQRDLSGVVERIEGELLVIVELSGGKIVGGPHRRYATVCYPCPLETRQAYFTAEGSDDSVKTDLELTCTGCGTVLYDIEAGDDLPMLLLGVKDHLHDMSKFAPTRG